ncbi:Uncharacterized protein Fot_33730 [Forsythia ovata]|uniref:Uncharacterized protein n=1 Tax=Forsythia ovata TaxID=205694 RepID=A0ABD1TC20_9LAMI
MIYICRLADEDITPSPSSEVIVASGFDQPVPPLHARQTYFCKTTSPTQFSAVGRTSTTILTIFSPTIKMPFSPHSPLLHGLFSVYIRHLADEDIPYSPLS